MLICKAITLYDFHPHWHILKPLPGFSYTPPPPPILDPYTRAHRRTIEAERRAHNRTHQRRRQTQATQTGRIMSQFEGVGARVRHCSACVPYGHDKARCQGCLSSGHTRASCPFQGTPAIQGIQQEYIRQYEGVDMVEDSREGLSVVPATQY